MASKVEAHALELYAINTGELYKRHLALAGRDLGTWMEHVQSRVLPRYCREIEPATATNAVVIEVASRLMGYYLRQAAETKAAADAERNAADTKRGELLAHVLRIRKGYADDAGLYPTEWGTKTAAGLFRTVLRICTEDLAKLGTIE